MRKIKRFFRFRSSIERDVIDELCFHIETRIAENLAAGMTNEQSQADALRRFGDLEKVKQSCLAIDCQPARASCDWALGLLILGGVGFWTNDAIPQLNVLGQTIIITSFLLLLFRYVRLRPTRRKSFADCADVAEPLQLTGLRSLHNQTSAPKWKRLEWLIVLTLLIFAIISALVSLTAFSTRSRGLRNAGPQASMIAPSR